MKSTDKRVNGPMQRVTGGRRRRRRPGGTGRATSRRGRAGWPRPRSAEEVADEVRQAAADGLTVRMAGTGHSFTPAAATDGVLLRPAG